MSEYPPRKIEEIPYSAEKRYLMEISFDGSVYGGWQIQPNSLCVQEVVQKVLQRLYDNQPIELTGSSRTDAGVHAINFAAAFPVPVSPAIPMAKLKNALNRLLPADIRIRSIKEMPLSFHARFDACGKAYVYVVNLGDETPFSNHYSLHPKYKINKTYIAEVNGRPTAEEMNSFAKGLVIDGQKTAPAKIRRGPSVCTAASLCLSFNLFK